jgi:hypothetical protein
MAAVIVIGSVAFGAALVLAWCLRPDLRARLEQPKIQFQDEARRYDRAMGERG